ncbi:hypothetical protein ACJX0J_036925 [Zea mays]
MDQLPLYQSLPLAFRQHQDWLEYSNEAYQEAFQVMAIMNQWICQTPHPQRRPTFLLVMEFTGFISVVPNCGNMMFLTNNIILNNQGDDYLIVMVRTKKWMKSNMYLTILAILTIHGIELDWPNEWANEWFYMKKDLDARANIKGIIHTPIATCFGYKNPIKPEVEAIQRAFQGPEEQEKC